MVNYDLVPYGKTCIGSCGLCGGPVCVHTAWCSVVPDTPTCAQCGAIKADNYGPVIPMVKPAAQAAQLKPHEVGG